MSIKYSILYRTWKFISPDISPVFNLIICGCGFQRIAREIEPLPFHYLIPLKNATNHLSTCCTSIKEIECNPPFQPTSKIQIPKVRRKAVQAPVPGGLAPYSGNLLLVATDWKGRKRVDSALNAHPPRNPYLVFLTVI